MGTSRVVKSSKSHVGLLCAVVLVLTILAAPAWAGYLIGCDDLGFIYDIDVSTGLATNPRATGIGGLMGLAFSPDNVLYGIDGVLTRHPVDGSLYIIDPITGSSSLIGSSGFDGATGLDFGPSDGTLYGVDTKRSYTLNLDTAQATLGGPVETVSQFLLTSLVVMPSGEAYGLEFYSHELLNFDPLTGAINSTVTVSQQFNYLASMEYDEESGIMYVADGGSDNSSIDILYTLNLDTGILTTIGPLDFRVGSHHGRGLSGLAIIPEPATMSLLALGGLAVLRRRRK